MKRKVHGGCQGQTKEETVPAYDLFFLTSQDVSVAAVNQKPIQLQVVPHYYSTKIHGNVHSSSKISRMCTNLAYKRTCHRLNLQESVFLYTSFTFM